VSELPQGWAMPTLCEVADWGSGGTPSRTHPEYYGGDIPWIKTGELGQGLITDTEEKLTELGLRNSSAKIFPSNSVAIAMYGATIGKTSILGIDAATNQACAVGIPKKGVISTEYLYHYLSSQKDAFIGAGKGGAQPNISQGVIKEWPILLAPLNEQKRIADKLNQLLAAVDSCKTRLDTIPAIIKRFRQSVLSAATSGQLTADWREENIPTETGEQVIQNDALNKQKLLLNDAALAKKKSSANSVLDEDYLFEVPGGWSFTTWGNVSEWITYGFTRPMPSSASGVKLVTAKDVLNFTLKIDQAGFTTPDAFNSLSDKDRPLRGDLLITKDGTIGRAALVKTDEHFCINQSVAVCWLRSTLMNKHFLELVANTEFTQKFVFEKAKGMAIQHLSITDFAQCPIPVPSLKEQTEIVSRVEALFAVADRLEDRYQTACMQVNRLTPALLAKAFCGELVPQDPTDEPAETLLERIRTQISSDSRKVQRTRKTIPAEQKEQIQLRRPTMPKNRHDHDVKGKPFLKHKLRDLGGKASAEQLYNVSDLPIVDFYKQLSDEYDQGWLQKSGDLVEIA